MSANHITVTVDAADAANIIEQYADEVRQIVAQRDELLAAAKLVIAWYEAEDDHSKADFYQRMEMCRESEAALRAAIAKVEGEKT